MKKILNIFNESAKARKLYDRLNSDPNKGNSVRLGVRAIIYSLIVVLFGALFGLGIRLFKTVADAEVGLILITILGGIVCVFAGIDGVLSSLFGAISATRYQFKLNKKSIRWVVLVVLILCVPISVIVGIITAGVIV